MYMLLLVSILLCRLTALHQHYFSDNANITKYGPYATVAIHFIYIDVTEYCAYMPISDTCKMITPLRL